MPQNLTDNKSTLVKVMAWCRQAINQFYKTELYFLKTFLIA